MYKPKTYKAKTALKQQTEKELKRWFVTIFCLCRIYFVSLELDRWK